MVVFIIPVILLGCNNFSKKNANVEVDKTETQKKEIYSSFEDLNLEKADVTLKLGGQELKLTEPVYIENNRYYVPLTDIAYLDNGRQENNDDVITIETNDDEFFINTQTKQYEKNGEDKKSFRSNIYMAGKVIYVSLFDLEKMFDYKVGFNYDSNTIFLNKVKDIEKGSSEKSNLIQANKFGLVRIEDLSLLAYGTEDAEEKLRIIADLFYSKNVPFHMAWIPRAKNPEKNIDEDLLAKNCMRYADFIYSIDYLIDRGCLIGLHGYTHQYGNEISAAGTELSATANASEAETRAVVEKGIATAKKLDIPISFYETPHYSGTEMQLKIVQSYFDVMFQPKKSDYVVRVKADNNKVVKYVPTPLNYIPDKDAGLDAMLKRIDTLQPNKLAGFYYHLFLETGYISMNRDENGLVTYNYDKNSILNKVLNRIIEKGYKFEKVTDVN
jgi:hypothetical protein